MPELSSSLPGPNVRSASVSAIVFSSDESNTGQPGNASVFTAAPPRSAGLPVVAVLAFLALAKLLAAPAARNPRLLNALEGTISWDFIGKGITPGFAAWEQAIMSRRRKFRATKEPKAEFLI